MKILQTANIIDSSNRVSVFNMLIFFVAVTQAFVPLFVDLPFRDNIYLSWEGAYRMYNGQMPFKDFGLPLGYIYWVLPAISFKIFGPYFSSLIKIQVLVNLISVGSFYTILRRFTDKKGIIFLSIFLYTISYSFINYWPWYNHFVIVLEFVSLAFVLNALKEGIEVRKKYSYLVIGACFSFLSFFTKQDGGFFSLFLTGTLVLYDAVINKAWKEISIYILSYVIIALVMILPLIPHDFNYWFNYGQAPHYSRVNIYDLMNEFFGYSIYIKLYLFIIAAITYYKFRNNRKWFLNRSEGLLFLLTLGILLQASVLQVTSYVPADGNIYFHSFVFFFVVYNFRDSINLVKLRVVLVFSFLLCLWWSGVYWKYIGRMFPDFTSGQTDNTEVVSIATYTKGVLPNDKEMLDKSTWTVPPYDAFENVKLPPECTSAIKKLIIWRDSLATKPKVLNMSELTPLAHVLDFELEKNTPLWYHKNVAMFDRELIMFKKRIQTQYYDMVLFENIPGLNNFYPFDIREELQMHYVLLFSFQAPREFTNEVIEVYLPIKN